MQDKKTFELTQDQINVIIIQDLKEQLILEAALRLHHDQSEFFDSYSFVLKHYMTEHEYKAFIKQLM